MYQKKVHLKKGSIRVLYGYREGFQVYGSMYLRCVYLGPKVPTYIGSTWKPKYCYSKEPYDEYLKHRVSLHGSS